MISLLWLLLMMLFLHLVTPFWWWIMLVPFVWFLVRGGRVSAAAVAGAAGAGLLWCAMAAWMLYLGGADLIAARVSALTGLGGPVTLWLLTTAVAAGAGGVSASAGAALRQGWASRR